VENEFFLSAKKEVADGNSEWKGTGTSGQTNNWQFVRFNFCVHFQKNFNFTLHINQTEKLPEVERFLGEKS